MPGKLRDGERTRKRILAAAQEVFSTHGYAQAGVRDITALAGVNAALVNRYFGSKEQLFEAALSELLKPESVEVPLDERFGQAIVARFAAASDQANPLRMMMLAMADAGARAVVDRLLRERFIEPLGAWLGEPHGLERAAQLAALAAGLSVYRSLYPLDPMQGEFTPGTREWLERAFQSIIVPPG
ncbi:MAG: TetR family transcriptional regulator [Novosphingobium sp.]|nr:TetR family transcriptional regulator [Novosphingobium sp.]